VGATLPENSLWYHFLLLLAAICFTLLVALVNTALYARLAAQRLAREIEGMGGGERTKEERQHHSDPGYFSRTILTHCPMSLGIGTIWYKALNLPLYIFPLSSVRSLQDSGDGKNTAPSGAQGIIYEFIVLLLTNILLTRLSIRIKHAYRRWCRKNEIPMAGDAPFGGSCAFLRREVFRVVETSFPFVYALAWANFGYFLVFRVGFNCPILTAECPDKRDEQFFIQLYYAVGLTVFAVKSIPGIRGHKLHPNSIIYLLMDDNDMIALEDIRRELDENFFMISIGIRLLERCFNAALTMNYAVLTLSHAVQIHCITAE